MPHSLKGRRILVIDDDISTAELLAELLMASGAETALAHDGAAALAELDRFAADIAMVDIELADMSGHELAVRIREKAPRVAMVALTGHAEAWARTRSEAAGFVAHLVKPIDTAGLIALLASLPASSL